MSEERLVRIESKLDRLTGTVEVLAGTVEIADANERVLRRLDVVETAVGALWRRQPSS